MGFFRTKDPKTGEPRLGAGVYLIICAAMIGGVILWNVRQNANDPSFLGGRAPVTTAPKNPTNIAPVAEAAKQHREEVASDTPGVAADTSSARNFTFGDKPTGAADLSQAAAEEDKLDTVKNTVEILRENKERANKEKEEAVAKAQEEANAKIAELKKKALITTTIENPDGTRSTAVVPAGTAPASKFGPAVRREDQSSSSEVSTQALTVYDAKRDAPKAAVHQAPPAPTGFDTKDFLPRGFLFPVYILTTIQTVNQEDLVIMGVAENVIFQHKVQIPFGTRLLGSAAASSFEDRVSVNIDTILYPDGRELPVSAFLKDAADLSSGVRGYYIPQPLQVQLVPYVNEFIAAWTQATADRFANNNNSNDNSSSNNGEGTRAAADSTANLIRAQAQKIQERLDRRFPEKVVVPIGTKAYAQIRSPLDLSQARIAGSLGNTQPVLPGFENNPISPAGVVERSANKAPAGQLTSTEPAAPAPQSPAVDEQQQAAGQQQAQGYLNAMNQLNSLEKQLQSSRARNAQSANNRSSAINFPKGDIE